MLFGTIIFYRICRYRLRPRVLIDVSKLDTTVKILGKWVEFPIGVSPTAMQKMAHPDGEIATAKGLLKLRCIVHLNIQLLQQDEVNFG